LIRRILLAARKDLLRRWRAPLAVGTILLFPLILSGILALVFGAGGDPGAARLLLDDQDSGPTGQALIALSQQPGWAGRLEVIPVTLEEGMRRLEADRADAMLSIPVGFTGAWVAGAQPRLELIRNPARGLKPELIERALRGVVAAMEESGASIPTPPPDDATPEQGLAWFTRAVDEISAESSLLSPPTVVFTESVRASDNADSSGKSSIFLLVLPGISIWALFMIGDIGMRDVLTEAVEGTLRRQLSSHFSVSQLLLAKCVATAALAGIAWLLLCALGFWAVERSIDLIAFSLLSIALVLAVTGFSSVIYGLVHTERQGATFSSVVVLLMSFVGGAFIPVDALPPVLRMLAPVSPVYWANRAFGSVLQDGAGLAAVGGATLALALLGIGTLALGSRLLHRSLLRGRLA